MAVVRGLAVLLLVAVAPVCSQVMRDQTPAQMKGVVREALATGKRVDRIAPKIVKKTVVFDVTLVPNPDETGWMTLLNLTPQQLGEAKARYEPEGYRVWRRASISANGQSFISTVWLKSQPPISTLKLPKGRLPEEGAVIEYLSPIDELMRDFLEKHNASGATLAIAKDGKVVYDRAFGWADANRRKGMSVGTLMRVADVSKAFTAVAAMQLVEEAKLKLDEPAMPLLVKARFRGASSVEDARWNEMTPRQLLSHRAGFAASPDIMFRTPLVAQELKLKKDAVAKDIVRYQLQRELASQPGAEFAYSDFGYCLLARVLEIADDRPYGSCVLQNILKPLEMTDTKRGRSAVGKRPKQEAWYHMQREKKGAAYWTASKAQVRRAGKTVRAPDIVRQPDGVFQVESMSASGGWISTSSDLVKFLVGLENKDAPLVDAETLEMMLEKPNGVADDVRQWYGLGWWVTETDSGKRFWHGGSMAGSSAMLVREENGIAWAVLFNTDISKADGKPLAATWDTQFRTALSEIEWP